MRPSILRRRSPSRRALAGFTLIELMVIVTIVMIIAALAAPGMMRGLAVNRAQRGVGQLARLGRRARSEAQAYGRAYAMVYAPGTNGTGRYELWRGLNDGCRTNPWFTGATPMWTAAGCDSGDPDCTDVLDTASYGSSGHTVAIVTPAPHLCFEPDGDMYVQTGGVWSLPSTGVRIQVDRFDGSVSATAPVDSRVVVFPPLAAPRVM